MEGYDIAKAGEVLRSPEVLETSNRVAVLDQGGQYVDLIKKNAERLGFVTDVLPFDAPAEDLLGNYGALIISGSPANSQEEQAPLPDPELWKSDMPILGICYGMHAMVSAQGGLVERGESRQDGQIKTSVTNSHPLFHETKTSQAALFTHGNFVTKIPDNFTVIGTHEIKQQDSQTTVISAIENGKQVGVQFHPEVFDETPEGYQIFKNFFEKIAEISPDNELLERQVEHQIEEIRTNIRRQAKDKDIIAFVSGGVDSSVAITLAATEIQPERLHAYFIDNGFMRDEDEAVIDLLTNIGVQVTKVDATEQFMSATSSDSSSTLELEGVIDPQAKRKIIGKTFVDVQNQLIEDLGLDEAMLLQGTNAADRIESGHSKGGQETAVIKTHHNQVKEVQDLKERGLLIEPLDELFKDEIRSIGRHLGLPSEVVDRHPFPGPGLAIRILGNRTNGEAITDVDTNELIQKFLKDQYWFKHPDFSRVLPIRNVGVGGDERSHVAPVALQMPSNDWEQLGHIAKSLPEVFRDKINRVIVSLGPNPLYPMSMTSTRLGQYERFQLKHADRIVFEEMRNYEVLGDIKQCPVVLLPLSFDNHRSRSIVLRPVTTSTFMTVKAMLPGRDLPEEFVTRCSERILSEVSGISQVFLDLTNKPPGTTEWE